MCVQLTYVLCVCVYVCVFAAGSKERHCDVIAITNADGDLLPATRRVQAEYTSALKLIRKKTKHWSPQVTCSL